jgi:hypothetical protein
MDRRRFLQLVAGAGVTTATLHEAGFVADFFKWLQNPRSWFIPKKPGIKSGPETFRRHIIPADEYFPELAGPALSTLATIYYDKRAIENLKHNTTLWEGTNVPRTLPASGKRIIHFNHFIGDDD